MWREAKWKNNENFFILVLFLFRPCKRAVRLRFSGFILFFNLIYCFVVLRFFTLVFSIFPFHGFEEKSKSFCAFLFQRKTLSLLRKTGKGNNSLGISPPENKINESTDSHKLWINFCANKKWTTRKWQFKTFKEKLRNRQQFDDHQKVTLNNHHRKKKRSEDK